MSIGACDVCNRQGVPVWRCWVCQIETWACEICSGIEPQDKEGENGE
jgi:hypothetical protein